MAEESDADKGAWAVGEAEAVEAGARARGVRHPDMRFVIVAIPDDDRVAKVFFNSCTEDHPLCALDTIAFATSVLADAASIKAQELANAGRKHGVDPSASVYGADDAAAKLKPGPKN